MKFVLSDDSKENSYGFVLDMAGGDLERFRKNPVLFEDHHVATSATLGRWDNIEVSDGVLTAEPIFDEADEIAKKLKGKVDRGFVRGSSLGILPKGNFVLKNNKRTLMKWELLEASITSLPSDSNALRVYNTEGKQLSDNQIYKLFMDIKEGNETTLTGAIVDNATATKQNTIGTNKDEKVNEITIGLDAKNVVLMSESIKKLTDQVTNLTVVVEKTLTSFIEDKNKTLALAKANTATLKTVTPLDIEKMKMKGTGATAGSTKFEDFQKLSVDEQIKFKRDNEDAYSEMVNSINISV